MALIAFIRKRLPEIQYLKATISEEQRQDFGRLVETTISQIEAGHFGAHGGIRFRKTCAQLVRTSGYVFTTKS